MKQNPKLFLFFYQIFFFVFIFSGCGLPEDSIKNIDKNIEEIKEAVKDDGVQIIIKGVDYSTMPIEEIIEIIRFSGRVSSDDDDLVGYGITNPEEVFGDKSSESDDESINILQGFARELTEELESPDIEDEDRANKEALLEAITELLNRVESPL